MLVRVELRPESLHACWVSGDSLLWAVAQHATEPIDGRVQRVDFHRATRQLLRKRVPPRYSLLLALCEVLRRDRQALNGGHQCPPLHADLPNFTPQIAELVFVQRVRKRQTRSRNAADQSECGLLAGRQLRKRSYTVRCGRERHQLVDHLARLTDNRLAFVNVSDDGERRRSTYD